MATHCKHYLPAIVLTEIVTAYQQIGEAIGFLFGECAVMPRIFVQEIDRENR